VKIYTRGGDTGQTSLAAGIRVAKDDFRIAVIGDVDELNSVIGWSASSADSDLKTRLERIQSTLFEIGAGLASESRVDRISNLGAETAVLEAEIDAMTEHLEPLRNFILPGGSEASSRLHLARSVCRRAERSLVALHKNAAEFEATLAFLNRLSDWLFVAARWSNSQVGVPDTIWRSKL